MPYIKEQFGSPTEPFEQEVIQSNVDILQIVYDRVHAEKEGCKEYMNEYQVMLYDFMNSLPLSDIFKDELHKVVLASNVSSIREFISAKNILFKMANDIKDGVLTVSKTLRAIFVVAHNKALYRIDKSKSSTINTISG